MAMLDWDLVDDVFQGALTRPGLDREAWIAARCADHLEVAREVRTLLVAHDRAERFLEPPTAPPFTSGADALVGTRVGAYELVREIGRGGMGTVYLGRRIDGAFEHQVAVKLTHAVAPGPELARRFDAERQILAALHHRNIVTLLDGGTTAQGQPYLITEFIDGLPITEFVGRHRMGLGQRLRLFRQACGAVHAAHQHGVVHRDLKPANVLVTDDGTVKVLDFGVAKLLTASVDSPASTTRLVPLTPGYASPEQLAGAPVTTASDVYALGVVLCELLAGVPPRATDERALAGAVAPLVYGPAVRPSARAVAATGLPYPPSRLRGDLDAIVAKAMQPETGDRYGSADEFSRDVQRVLDGQPVVARQPSFGYVAAKMIRRHRTAFAVAALGLVAILGAVGVAAWQRQQATQARLVAAVRSADLRRLTGTLIVKLDEAVRTQSPTEARQLIVSEALAYLNALAADSADPTLSIELADGYLRVGGIQGDPAQSNLGDRAAAAASARRALELVEPLAEGPEADDRVFGLTIRAHRMLSTVLPAPESLAAAHRAVDVATRWHQSTTGEAPQSALASALFTLASRLPWPESRAHWEASGRAFEALLAAQPENPARMRNVALVDKYLTPLLLTTERAEATRRAERAARLDDRRLALQPSDRQTRLDAAISLSQFSDFQSGPARLAGLERSVVLREAVAREDPADRFTRAAVRRSLVLLAEARVGSGDETGARRDVARALASFAPADAQPMDDLERFWLARAHLVMAGLEARRGRLASGCNHLTRARTESAASQAVGGGEIGADLMTPVSDLLPACSPAAP
jgi:hypothetical protein